MFKLVQLGPHCTGTPLSQRFLKNEQIGESKSSNITFPVQTFIGD